METKPSSEATTLLVLKWLKSTFLRFEHIENIDPITVTFSVLKWLTSMFSRGHCINIYSMSVTAEVLRYSKPVMLLR